MKKIIMGITVFLIVVSISLGHKDAVSSSESVASYEIEFGKIPLHSYENNEESFFLDVKKLGEPATGLNAVFLIYKDVFDLSDLSSGTFVGKYTSGESDPGLYVTQYRITQKGNYLVKAELYKDTTLITQMSKTFSVEPNGPSSFFWIFMLTTLVIGVFVASRSHKI